MWDKIQREKKAGGYPWTHLQHNCNDEVWINPLNLPMDISKETIRRKDGTLPSEWFHLPNGAETPSVDELMRDSPSPEPELELLDTSDNKLEESFSEENLKISTIGRKTPTGRRTPICGKHRNRHKSTGSSPGPSIKSQRLTSPKHHHRTLSQPDNLQTTSEGDSKNGGYEPVGQMSASKSVGGLPQGRLPDSELPTLPSEDSDNEDGCFTLRRSRSRSKERKGKKISPRSPSRDSKCSEHPYETPKLLPKNSSKQIEKDKSLVDFGYEPIGNPMVEAGNEKSEGEACVEEIVHFTRTVNDIHSSSNDKTEIHSHSNTNFFTNFLKKISKDEKKASDEMKVVLNIKEGEDEEKIKGIKNDEEATLKIKRKELEERQKLEKESVKKAEEVLKRKEAEDLKRLNKQKEDEMRRQKKENEELKRREAEELKRKKKERELEVKKQKRDEEDLKRKLRQEEEELKNLKKAEDEENKRKKKEMEIETKRIKKERELQQKSEQESLKREQEEIKRKQKMLEIESKRLQKERENFLKLEKEAARKEHQRLIVSEKEERKRREKQAKEEEKRIKKEREEESKSSSMKEKFDRREKEDIISADNIQYSSNPK